MAPGMFPSTPPPVSLFGIGQQHHTTRGCVRSKGSREARFFIYKKKRTGGEVRFSFMYVLIISTLRSAQAARTFIVHECASPQTR